MTPPKCLLKRHQAFNNMNESVWTNLEEYDSKDASKDAPLDLSCKIDDSMLSNEEHILQNSHTFNHPMNWELIDRFNRFLMHQNNQMLPRLNLDNFRHKLADILSSQSPILLPSPSFSDNSMNNFSISDQTGPGNTRRAIEYNLLSADRFLQPQNRNSNHNSSTPDSLRSPESQIDNLSEISSLCTNSTKQNQKRLSPSKRKNDSKMIRPFKLYKNNDSKSIFEALNITEEDETWLKMVVEHKNVDDIFQFLTDVMNNAANPITDGFTNEILEKIKEKFGYIFVNCNTTVSNPRMIRHPDMTPKELKTEEYWERRRKNNEAAKRSREARRNKEELLTRRCDELQKENEAIRKEIEHVKIKIDEFKTTKIC